MLEEDVEEVEADNEISVDEWADGVEGAAVEPETDLAATRLRSGKFVCCINMNKPLVVNIKKTKPDGPGKQQAVFKNTKRQSNLGNRNKEVNFNEETGGGELSMPLMMGIPTSLSSI